MRNFRSSILSAVAVIAVSMALAPPVSAQSLLGGGAGGGLTGGLSGGVSSLGGAAGSVRGAAGLDARGTADLDGTVGSVGRTAKHAADHAKGAADETADGALGAARSAGASASAKASDAANGVTGLTANQQQQVTGAVSAANDGAVPNGSLATGTRGQAGASSSGLPVSGLKGSANGSANTQASVATKPNGTQLGATTSTDAHGSISR